MAEQRCFNLSRLGAALFWAALSTLGAGPQAWSQSSNQNKTEKAVVNSVGLGEGKSKLAGEEVFYLDDFPNPAVQPDSEKFPLWKESEPAARERCRDFVWRYCDEYANQWRTKKFGGAMPMAGFVRVRKFLEDFCMNDPQVPRIRYPVAENLRSILDGVFFKALEGTGFLVSLDFSNDKYEGLATNLDVARGRARDYVDAYLERGALLWKTTRNVPIIFPGWVIVRRAARRTIQFSNDIPNLIGQNPARIRDDMESVIDRDLDSSGSIFLGKLLAEKLSGIERGLTGGRELLSEAETASLLSRVDMVRKRLDTHVQASAPGPSLEAFNEAFGRLKFQYFITVFVLVAAFLFWRASRKFVGGRR